MKKRVSSFSLILILVLVLYLCSAYPSVEAQSCKLSGSIRERKPPSGQCNLENDSDCCKEGQSYTTYKCLPPTSHRTKAVLSLDCFEEGSDGGAPSECNDKFHSDDIPVVALSSTGWLVQPPEQGLKYITIHANGRSVNAMAADECDSSMGCDSDHDYQPPCPNNIVDASRTAWKALGVPQNDWDELDISWANARVPVTILLDNNI